MAYCTYTELTNLTGSIKSSTIQGAIIDSADREINTYLSAHGVTGAASDALKEASLKLSQAGLLELALQEGRYIASDGTMLTGPDISTAMNLHNAIKQLREQAFALLDQYISAQSTSPGSIRVSRVRSRCG